MKKVRTILSFEYFGYLKSKSFIVTTIIFLIVIIVGSQIPRFMGAFPDIGSVLGGGEKQRALFVLKGEAKSLEETIDIREMDAATGNLYKWIFVDENGKWMDSDTSGMSASQVEMLTSNGGAESPGDEMSKPTIERLVANGDVDVVLVYEGGDHYELYGKGQDLMLSALPALLDPFLTGLARDMKMEDLIASERTIVKEVMDTTVVGKVNTVGGGAAENNFWLAYVMLYVLFISIVIYSQFIVTSVISEKSSKAMELLVTSAKPIELMFGKVLGVGSAAFTQMGMIVIVSCISISIGFKGWIQNVEGFDDMISQMNISGGLLVFFVLFFVIGYFQYAFICAAMGSTASRVEDSGSVSTLPSMLAVISFIISMVSMSNIDATYVQVLSYIPLFSPWIMFGRLCMASATFTEAAISVVILVVSVFFFGWLSAKIYRVGVMMYGKPMKIGTVLKMAFRS